MQFLVLERQAWWPRQRWPWWRLLLFALLLLPSMLLMVLVVSTFTAFFAPVTESVDMALAMSALRLWTLLLVFAILGPLRLEFRDFSGLFDVKRIAPNAGIAIVAGVVSCGATACASAAIFALGEAMSVEWPESLRVTDPTVWLIETVDSITVVPVMEEVVFRGLLLCFFASRWKSWSAIIGSAACFWAVHFFEDVVALGTIEGLVILSVTELHALIMGIALGWYQLRAGSLYAPIAIHAFINLLVEVVFPV